MNSERHDNDLAAALKEVGGMKQAPGETQDSVVEDLANALKDAKTANTRPVELHAEEPSLKLPASNLVPEMSRAERMEVARRTSLRPLVVLEAVREEGEGELQRPSAALAISGLAAGLSMGFSMMAQGLIRTTLPIPYWGPLIENFGYSLGFLVVVLGRQQLFTENTLTVMVPLFAHPSWRLLGHIVRLWTVVLVANLVGALIFATVVAHTGVFPPAVQHSFAEVAQHSLRGDFGLTVLRGIFAGWLIALMVWLLPASEGTRLHIVILLTYIVALGGFAHIIAGSVDVLYLVNIGAVSWYTFFFSFMIPTLLGNILGGVLLVALLNFGQVAAEKLAIRNN